MIKLYAKRVMAVRSDSRWFLNIFFLSKYPNGSRDAPPPHTFMAKSILNFHFDYWNPSLRQPQCLTQVYRRLQACCCLQLVEHKSLEEAREPNKIYARFLNSCSIRIRFCPPSSPSAEEDFNTNMNRVYTCTVFFVSSFH